MMINSNNSNKSLAYEYCICEKSVGTTELHYSTNKREQSSMLKECSCFIYSEICHTTSFTFLLVS